MSKSYPKVPIGDGRHCYSGPNCRLHGVQQTVYAKSKELNKEQFHNYLVADAKENLGDEKQQKITDFICAESQDMDDLKGLGAEAFIPGKAARLCKTHNTYHVYDIGNVHRELNSLVSKARVAYYAAKDMKLIERKEISDVMSTIKKETAFFSAPHTEDKAAMIEFQRSQKDTEFGDIATARREEYRKEHHLKSIRAPKPKAPEEPAVLDQSKVDDKTILEYWQCGRKRVHESRTAADSWLKEDSKQDPDDPLESYDCRHCGKVHVGHGGGKDSVESQIERGRAHWNKTSTKSNVFAFKKGLI